VAYRPTERTEARRLATRSRIVESAQALVAQGGYREAHVAAVASRAGVAVGTVYRHFHSKAELFVEVFRRAARREVEVTRAAMEGPAPASERIAAGVETFARRALRAPHLAWALLAEPADPALEAERLAFRRAYRDCFAAALADGIAAGELPAQNVEVSAAALVGAIGEALVGPLSPASSSDGAEALVESLSRFCIRSVTIEEPRNVSNRVAA
jgi:AcrR family transcriptional regulator